MSSCCISLFLKKTSLIECIIFRFHLCISGVFSEIYTAPDFTVELRRYAHRELSQLLVVELLVNRNASSRPITISFSVNSGGLSEDIHFQQEGPGLVLSVVCQDISFVMLMKQSYFQIVLFI